MGNNKWLHARGPRGARAHSLFTHEHVFARLKGALTEVKTLVVSLVVNEKNGSNRTSERRVKCGGGVNDRRRPLPETHQVAPVLQRVGESRRGGATRRVGAAPIVHHRANIER